MEVPGREHINFTSAFISPLSLFSCHNLNVLFWVENKKKLIYFRFNEKQNNFAFYFHFKIIKVQFTINKFVSFYLSLAVWVQKWIFDAFVLKFDGPPVKEVLATTTRF